MAVRSGMALFAAGLAVFTAGPAIAAPIAASKAWTGRWQLNLAQSTFNSVAPPRSEVRMIAVPGKRMSVRSYGVAATGKRMHFNYSVALDGRFYPLVGNPDGDSISMTLLGPRKVDIEVRRHRKPSASAITEVSADGRQLRMDRRRRSSTGEFSNDVLVYDRIP